MLIQAVGSNYGTLEKRIIYGHLFTLENGVYCADLPENEAENLIKLGWCKPQESIATPLPDKVMDDGFHEEQTIEELE